MGRTAKAILTLLVAVSVYAAIKLNALLDVPTPELEETWWGQGAPREVDAKVKPFEINVADEVLQDLKRRLNDARPFTRPLEGVQQQYGMNTDLLAEIVEYWRTEYDWRERERFLNGYPQFTTNVQGLDVHFIHARPQNVSSGVAVLPLLMLHGWPGSVREFYEIIPLLTRADERRGFAFEVVAPSLPGFGFSRASARRGLGPAQIGLVLKNLMSRLGFDRFYLHGGDWGAIIASQMSSLFPESVLGTHSNMCVSVAPVSLLGYFLTSLYPAAVVEEKYLERFLPVGRFLELVLLEGGYFHIQATKPDTIGVSLNESPAGLAAYILEKFTSGTDPGYQRRKDGGLKLKYSYADLLDNVMIYWVTNSMTTAMRLYAEGYSREQLNLQMDRLPVTTPYACAKFRYEIFYMPDFLLSMKYKNLVHSAHYDEGGHFAAFEMPKALAGDIWTAVEKMQQTNPQK